MLLWQALFLGALQGVSELFPVSSLAQTILIPALLGWSIDAKGTDFLAFVVALHLATAIALVVYFWKDWQVVISAFIGSAKRRKFVYDQPSKFAWLLVAGTIIVGLLGLAFERRLRELFDDPAKAWIVAAVLVANGFIMLMADMVKRRALRTESSGAAGENHQIPVAAGAGASGEQSTGVMQLQYATSAAQRLEDAQLHSQRRNAEQLTFIEAAAIGATQSFALVPGISRSGVTIVAGLLAGLTYEQASRFSFMLATPVIGLAALLKVPKLFAADAHEALKMAIPSAILAGLTAYFSTKFLMHYFKNHRLSPFGWYCIIFGIFSLIWLRHGGI